MKTTVRREGDRVWLEGVNGWFVGDKESSIHAAQEAVMQAIGEDISYVDLLGTSGLAFRMQVSKDGLCPSSPHSFCGYQCVAGSVNALPWKITVYEAKADDVEAVKVARQAVVDSILRGVPVQYGSEEDGIIVGYQKDGEEWICFHPLREGGTKTFVETNWPWGIAVFTEPKETVPSKRELALDALKQAIEMSEAEEADGYYLGDKAWDDYLTKLRALREADDETRKGAMLTALKVSPQAEVQRCGALGLWETDVNRAQAAPGNLLTLRWVWEAIETPVASLHATLILRDVAGL